MQFPDTRQALKQPNGLLAVGADLRPSTLLHAYSQGIFPWYDEPEDIHWWSPDPRMVLFPKNIRCSKSMNKHLRRQPWYVTINRSFNAVIEACSASRRDAEGTWIGPSMITAYQQLHQLGFAHSVEVFDQSDLLVGGLYGLGLGRMFFGESMFSSCSNASKQAFIVLAQWAEHHGIEAIDCQVSSPHLRSLGAEEIARYRFEALLQKNITSDFVSTTRLDWQKSSNKVIFQHGHFIT